MNDPTWDIEKRLIDTVPAYTEDTGTIAAILTETIASPVFTGRWEFPIDLEVFIPEDSEEDSFLNQLEEHEGRDRGAIVGLSFIDAEDPPVAEVHVRASTAPIIVLHECAHALTLRGDHGTKWLSMFRLLSIERYGVEAGIAFDTELQPRAEVAA